MVRLKNGTIYYSFDCSFGILQLSWRTRLVSMRCAENGLTFKNRLYEGMGYYEFCVAGTLDYRRGLL